MEQSNQVARQVAISIFQLRQTRHTNLCIALSCDQELVDGHGGIAGYHFAREQVQLDLLYRTWSLLLDELHQLFDTHFTDRFSKFCF